MPDSVRFADRWLTVSDGLCGMCVCVCAWGGGKELAWDRKLEGVVYRRETASTATADGAG